MIWAHPFVFPTLFPDIKQAGRSMGSRFFVFANLNPSGKKTKRAPTMPSALAQPALHYKAIEMVAITPNL
ncbi:MAG: hypothetical protein L0G16_00115 [Weeksellaceae bacterium]|nr:hypothetical protein [Weeksellaceae bacterium]